MAQYFLVTVLKNENVESFKNKPDPELVGWTPVAISGDETEQDIVDNFKKQGITVIGLESLDLLKQKIKLIEDFRSTLKE